MATVKGKRAGRPKRAATRGGSLVMRVQTTGPVVEHGPRHDKPRAEITLTPAVFSSVTNWTSAVKGLVTGFGKAAHRAEQSGKPVRLTVLVEPGGTASAIAVEGHEKRQERGDDLDAALAEAGQRGATRVADILSADDMLGADAFADLIGVTRETVHQKRRRHEILGLEGAKRGVRFPSWQLTADGGLLPGLPELFAVLGGSSWSIYRFLLQRHPELEGKTALDALKQRDVETVLNAARNVASGAFA